MTTTFEETANLIVELKDLTIRNRGEELTVDEINEFSEFDLRDQKAIVFLLKLHEIGYNPQDFVN